MCADHLCPYFNDWAKADIYTYMCVCVRRWERWFTYENVIECSKNLEKFFPKKNFSFQINLRIYFTYRINFHNFLCFLVFFFSLQNQTEIYEIDWRCLIRFFSIFMDNLERMVFFRLQFKLNLFGDEDISVIHTWHTRA